MIAWKGRRLAALDRRGHVRWSLTAPRPITPAHWSPSGFRVAYRSGGDLRVVAGDGTGDRLLDAGTFRPTAWRPGAAHVLAYISGSHVDVVDVDTRAAARAHPASPTCPARSPGRPTARACTCNLHRSIAVYDARGRRTGRIWMPRGQTVTTFVPARGGSLVAVARQRPHVERGRADAPRRPRPRPLPRRRALHAACASPPPAAGCSSPGRSPTSGSTSAPAPPARAELRAAAHVSRRFEAARLPPARGLVLPAV